MPLVPRERSTGTPAWVGGLAERVSERSVGGGGVEGRDVTVAVFESWTRGLGDGKNYPWTRMRAHRSCHPWQREDHRHRSRSLRTRPGGVAGRVVSVAMSASEKRTVRGWAAVADVSRAPRLSDGLSLARWPPSARHFLPPPNRHRSGDHSLSCRRFTGKRTDTLARARARTVPLTAADDADDWRARQTQ